MSEETPAAGHSLDAIADVVASLPEKPGSDRVPISEVTNVPGMTWMPSGPVCRNFVLHPAGVSLICGPYGSGKTTGAFVKGVLCSMAVPQSPEDDVRYARGAIVRDTYRNLEASTIPSWQERFPKTVGKWKGGTGGEPGSHVLDFLLEDETTLHLEVLFVAIGDHNVKQFCDGLQLTWCFVNGADETPDSLFDYMWPRLGRWPAPQHRPLDWKRYAPFWRKLFGDMNAPEPENWTIHDFVDRSKKGYKVFWQPGGMEDNAENKENLVDGYYEDLCEKHSSDPGWVNRFVHNKPGYTRGGTPVYEDYSEALHVSATKLKFDRRRPLLLGTDGGRDACSIAGQRCYNGRLNILAELIPPRRMGAKQFGRWLRDEIAHRFPDVQQIYAYLDPAAFDPNSEDDDYVWADLFMREFGGDAWSGICRPASNTNEFTARRDAVIELLRELDAGVPQLLLDPADCPMIRKGFASGYHYEDQSKGVDKRMSAMPVKNQYSHPHDALQYLALGSSDYRLLQALHKQVPQQDGREIRFHPHDF